MADMEETPRFDAQNRRLCHAHRSSDGKPCGAPAMTAQKVCRLHGGSTKNARNAARLRLMELVDPAITTLAKEMVNATESSDKQRAANSILDRAGLSRRTELTVDDARDMLIQKLTDNATDSQAASDE